MQQDTNLNEPIHCLHCGAQNAPELRACHACNTPLLNADPESGLLAQVGAATSIGRVRKNNEDSVQVWATEGVILALVADGMGGAAAGEEASRLVVEHVQGVFVGTPADSDKLHVLSETDLEDRLMNALQEANRAVVERSQSDINYRGMGTTSTLALIRGNRLFVAHVGDSRAYIVDRNSQEARQVTSDHTYVQALIASGYLEPDQANNHPMGNVLYRALGQGLDLDVDLYPPETLKAGDHLLLCSDGLTKHMTPAESAAIIVAAESPLDAAQRLISTANERGGEDNISVVVVSVTSTDDDTARLIPL